MNKLATFGGGCFWGMDKAFRRKFPTAVKVEVGYAGGKNAKTTYQEVCGGNTEHAEVVQIEYNPANLEYEAIVDFFFRMHDPLTKDRQGNDRGTQYRSSIFYHDNGQKQVAERMIKKYEGVYGQKLATTLEAFTNYCKAEGYHQDYLTNNPHGYECPTHFERTEESLRKQFKT